MRSPLRKPTYFLVGIHLLLVVLFFSMPAGIIYFFLLPGGLGGWPGPGSYMKRKGPLCKMIGGESIFWDAPNNYFSFITRGLIIPGLGLCPRAQIQA